MTRHGIADRRSREIGIHIHSMDPGFRRGGSLGFKFLAQFTIYDFKFFLKKFNHLFLKKRRSLIPEGNAQFPGRAHHLSVNINGSIGFNGVL